MVSERDVLARIRSNPKVEDVYLLSGDGDHQYSVLLKSGWRDWSDPHSPSRIICERYARDVERLLKLAQPFEEEGEQIDAA